MLSGVGRGCCKRTFGLEILAGPSINETKGPGILLATPKDVSIEANARGT